MSYSVSKVVSRYGQLRSTSTRKNGTIANDSTTVVKFSHTSSATKGEMPYWRREIKAGRDATTTLNGVDLHVHEWTPGQLTALNPLALPNQVYRTANYGMLSSQHQTLPSDPSSLSVTLADNGAKANFLKRLIKAQTAFHGGVFLGEIREVIRMIRRPARSLRDGLDDYYWHAKRRVRGVAGNKRRNEIVGNTWLEYSFGWKPLIHDLEDGFKAVNRLNERILRPIWDFCNAETSTASTSSERTGLIGQIVNVREMLQCNVKYQGAVDCTPLSPTRANAHLFGFRPEEIVPTIWELIPYSFLVDYFINIGEIINGWSYQRTGLAWTLRTVRKSSKRDVVVAVDPTYYSPSTFTLQSFASSSSYLERTSVSRASYTGNFIPSITFSIPGLRGRDALKWLNISALARIRTF